jgi:propionate CoA-transferase
MYISERAVFRLVSDGLELVEVAPGIDVEEHVLKQMDFRPILRNVKRMSTELFDVSS